MESALYNEMYAVEDRHWWFRARRKIVCHTLARLALPSTDSKPRLLDLGCGCGANLAAYARHFDAWGMDVSPPAAAFAQRRVGPRVCLGALPNELPFPADSFDVVVMTDVLEHLDDDRAAVANAMTLVREGGSFWPRSRRANGSSPRATSPTIIAGVTPDARWGRSSMGCPGGSNC